MMTTSFLLKLGYAKKRLRINFAITRNPFWDTAEIGKKSYDKSNDFRYPRSSSVIRKQLLARDETLVLYVPKKNQTTLLDPQRESMFQGDLLDLGRILRGMIGCEIVCLCEMPEPQVT